MLSRRSKPAASATRNSSPFASVSHPSSSVVLMVCSRKNPAIRTGEPWSKECASMTRRGRSQAAGGEVEDGCNLLPREASVQVHELVDRDAVFKVLEYRRNRHPRIAENPCPVARFWKGPASRVSPRPTPSKRTRANLHPSATINRRHAPCEIRPADVRLVALVHGRSVLDAESIARPFAAATEEESRKETRAGVTALPSNQPAVQDPERHLLLRCVDTLDRGVRSSPRSGRGSDRPRER